MPSNKYFQSERLISLLCDGNWGDSKEVLSQTPQPIWGEEETQKMLIAAVLNWREGIMRPGARWERPKRKAKVKRKGISIAIILMLLKDCTVLGTILSFNTFNPANHSGTICPFY